MIRPNRLQTFVSRFAWFALCGAALGCHRQQQAIAVIPRTTATLLWEPLHQGIAETARGTGLKVYWNAPSNEGNTERQMDLYGSLQGQGYRGFIFTPDETLAARTAVLATNQRGVPVVIVDDELGPPPSRLLSYVSNDEAAGTMLAAQQVARMLHGRGAIAVTGIIPRSEISLTRAEDFEAAMARVAPGVHIVSRRFGDTVVSHQQQIAQEILRLPEHVDAIVALSATASRGAYYAKLATEPQSSVHILGFDQDLVFPLQTGDVDAVIAQDTRTIGRIAMQHLQSEMRGDTVEGRTLVPPVLLTRDSLASTAAVALMQFPLYHWSEQ